MAAALQPPTAAYLAENRGTQVLNIVIVFPILSAITVLLRYYTRFFIIRNPSLEDFAIGIAMLLSIAVTVCTCYEVHYGIGRHVQALKPEQFIGFFKSLYASIVIYNAALLFTKTSILLQYLRISVPKNTRRTVIAVMVFVLCYGIECIFSGSFTCTPVAYFWDTSIPGGKCVDKFALYFANGGINIATDFVLLFLPAFILKGLKMPRRQKWILIGILAIGGAACIASIFRLHALYVLSISQDPLWDSPGTSTWSCVELNTGIICACISTLRPLFARLLPSVFGSANPSDSYVSSGQPSKGFSKRLDGSDGLEERQLRSKESSGKESQISEDLELGAPGAGPSDMRNVFQRGELGSFYSSDSATRY